MAESVLLGMQGTTTTECAYVESDIVPGVDFFAHKVCCHTTCRLEQPAIHVYKLGVLHAQYM
jgi:hypothetical protein